MDSVTLIREFRHLNTKQYIDKVVCLEGIIHQASPIRAEVTEITYECLDCGNRISVLQTEGTVKQSARCICGRKNFKESIIYPREYRDTRELKLKELWGDSKKDIILKGNIATETAEKLNEGTVLRIEGKVETVPIKKGSKIVDTFLVARKIHFLDDSSVESEDKAEDL